MDNVNGAQFGIGLLIVLVAAAFSVADLIGSGVAAAIVIMGIGLIAASGNWT